MDTLTSKYARAADIIVRAGILPFVISDTLLEIVKIYLTEEEIDFIIKNFDKETTLSIDQLKEKSGLSATDIEKMTDGLAKKGFIFNQPNTKGVMVYRLLPLIIVGAFEYTFMKERMQGDKIKEYEKIAKLYHKLLEELKDTVQGQYDAFIPIFEVQPAPDRTVPVFTNENGKPIKIIINETVKVEEQVLPSSTVEEIIRKNDDIAVGYCFCRNYNKVLGHDCETNAPNEVCFTFGKSARHVVNQGFARKITKEEALKIFSQRRFIFYERKKFFFNSVKFAPLNFYERNPWSCPGSNKTIGFSDYHKNFV
ncbi:hypothetical protein ER57_11805 [Smithella sp. SCADC]|jgi:hypothetical protein|nr:hypothetical protein ER57_11805 [Smithella sp. SCADC]